MGPIHTVVDLLMIPANHFKTRPALRAFSDKPAVEGVVGVPGQVNRRSAVVTREANNVCFGARLLLSHYLTSALDSELGTQRSQVRIREILARVHDAIADTANLDHFILIEPRLNLCFVLGVGQRAGRV